MNDFGNQDVYTLHIKKNRSNKMISPNCEACVRGFVHVNSLQVRKFTQTGKLPDVCKNCNDQFLKICRSQIRSMNQNENHSHACEICGKGFSHVGNYLKHRRLHEAATKASLIEVSGDNQLMVKGEAVQSESEDSNWMVEKIDSTFIVVSQKPDPPYVCEVCGKSFQRRGSYLNHCETHTSLKGGLRCPVCEKPCPTKLMLKNHLARCEARQPTYMCHYCEKSFASKSSLKTHLENHLAPPLENYLCKFCKEEFLVAELLEQHLLKHLNERSQEEQEKFNHFCVDCGKGFVNLGSLKNHMQSHEGDVPFECKTCKKQFVQSHRLMKHLKTCHKKEDSTYICKTCSKEFTYLKSFRRHKILHLEAKKLASTQM